MAEALLRLSHQSEQEHTPPLYVERDKLHRKFEELVRIRTPVIVFSGLPGVGKSDLARQLTQHGDRVWLDVTTEDTLYDDLVDALGARGVDTAATPAGLLQQLKNILLSVKPPQYVVLDA